MSSVSKSAALERRGREVCIKRITHSPEETVSFAQRVGGLLRSGDIIAYKGGLGVGKTTFTRGISMGLGLGDGVTSPTFALVNEYRCGGMGADGVSLIHFDMYRINGGADLETTGFYDYLSDKCVIAVEWSENIENELRSLGRVITVSLERISDDDRMITLEGDERFAVLGD